jgi:hypothetical protein
MLDTLPFSPGNVVTGSLGLLFDRERGLVAYAPVYLILPACWALSWKRYCAWIIPVMTLFLPMAAFSVWSAGFSPAARYVVPLVPLLIAPAVEALRYRTIRRVGLVLLVLQASILAVVWEDPRTLWPQERGTNEALARIPWIGRAYEQLLPSILTGDPMTWGGVLVIVLTAANATLVWRARRVGIDAA